MNLKDAFTLYIREQSSDGSNRASSHIRAIDLLDSILSRKAAADLDVESIWTISSAEHVHTFPGGKAFGKCYDLTRILLLTARPIAIDTPSSTCQEKLHAYGKSHIQRPGNPAGLSTEKLLCGQPTANVIQHMNPSHSKRRMK